MVTDGKVNDNKNSTDNNNWNKVEKKDIEPKQRVI